MRYYTDVLSKKKIATKTSTMAGEGFSTSRFLDLPDEILLEIARIVDPTICFDPSRFHALDSEFTFELFPAIRPDQTLARLTLVCKRFHRIYAPVSTWSSLYIRANDPRSAKSLGEKLETSPSVTRVLDYPETGIYARELLIDYEGYYKDGFEDALTCGTLVDFDRFLANTPRLETVRCIGRLPIDADRACLPIKFFASLSSLASLRYLSLAKFDMHFEVPPSFPCLHQVRILRFSPSRQTTIYGDLLRFAMPNIHTLHVINPCHVDGISGVDQLITDIQVRCPLSSRECLFRLLRLSPYLSLTRFFFYQTSATTLRQNLVALNFQPVLNLDQLRRIADFLRGGNLRRINAALFYLHDRDRDEAEDIFNSTDFPCLEKIIIPPRGEPTESQDEWWQDEEDSIELSSGENTDVEEEEQEDSGLTDC
jgi:hypothetical protein